MLSPAVKALKAKLQTKAKHRPHKMVKKKLPGAIARLVGKKPQHVPQVCMRVCMSTGTGTGMVMGIGIGMGMGMGMLCVCTWCS